MIIYLLWAFGLPYFCVVELIKAAFIQSVTGIILATPLLSTGILAVSAIEGLVDEPKVYLIMIGITYLIGVAAGYVAVYA